MTLCMNTCPCTASPVPCWITRCCWSFWRMTMAQVHAPRGEEGNYTDTHGDVNSPARKKGHDLKAPCGS
ncbi:hypothetical protein BRADI_4g12218v3 [Brachypodium distachyon]|uniref:Uncharacterized protein n=1 Tax=Brachypodium distachyon TaxID=15368 RepID=A0A2K2CMA1_BRADI|nr:hypothetical protein BRADI_4g12218v3 [Brachypodium distachyon]